MKFLQHLREFGLVFLRKVLIVSNENYKKKEVKKFN